VVITAVLTKGSRPIGRLYASDLIGAALGCLFVLVGLEFLDAPSFILLSGAIGIVAGLVFARQELSDKQAAEVYGMISIANDMESIGDIIHRNMLPLLVKKQKLGADFITADRKLVDSLKGLDFVKTL